MAKKENKILGFNNSKKNNAVADGAAIDNNMRESLRDALGITKRQVEASRHTVLSGPPGVGKTYGAMDELTKAGIKYVTVAPGMTPPSIICKLAHAVSTLKKDEEVVILMDDADDVVFNDYKQLNKWKLAMADTDHDLGIVPHFHHQANMLTTFVMLEKQGKHDLLDALKSFQQVEDVGISIPMDRVRFVVLCNRNLEDVKECGGKKMFNAIEPVVDRTNYSRMNLDMHEQWGWLAYVLSTTQPFEEEDLSDTQKIELLNWMYPNWDNLRTTSYRTVKKLAADMINFPDRYEDKWNSKLKG
jgi:hypothetical protein